MIECLSYMPSSKSLLDITPVVDWRSDVWLIAFINGGQTIVKWKMITNKIINNFQSK